MDDAVNALGIEELVAGLKLDDADVRKRLDQVGFAEADRAAVRALSPLLSAHAERLAGGFFDFLGALPEAAAPQRDPELLSAARQLKAMHLKAMAGGAYDADYAKERLRLALLYAGLGLDPKAFLGAFHHVLRGLGTLVIESQPDAPLEAFAGFMSLKKVAFFDIGIVVDALIYGRERVIRSRERELSATEEQLRQSQKMEAVGSLAGGVAHDFNNLLSVILGYGSLVQDSPNLDQDEKLYAAEIVKAAERAADLTRQLLAFSRQQVVEPKSIDLSSLLGGMEAMLRRLIGEDIRYQTVISAGLHRFSADVSHVEQVLMNLVVNARDAMPDGGTIVVEADNVELDEDYAREHLDARVGPHVMLAVSDTGIGMDAKTRSRIFEPFFTTKEKGRGTGLGLSTIYGIVKQNGGNIWVYSEVGKGSTFKVYFPAEQGPAAAVKGPEGPQRALAGGESILLVEDDPQVRGITARILRSKGYAVTEASGPQEALEIFAGGGQGFELLLTDVVMPGMNGRELAKRLLAIQPGLRVLFMSGYTQNVIVHHNVVDAGLVLLQKPFTPLGLLAKVRDVLEPGS